MSSVLLSLGNFKFSITTAAYNQLVKSWSWNWSNQSIIGKSDKLQAVGKSADSIKLKGEVSPLFQNVGTQQIESLAQIGDELKPQLLVSGLGDIMGYWCLVSLTETSSNFVKGGIARLQSFDLEIQFYGHNL